MGRVTWRFEDLIFRLIDGDRWWGIARLTVLLLVIFCLWIVGYLKEPVQDSVGSIANALGFLQSLGIGANMRLMLAKLLGLFIPPVARHLIAPVIAVVWAIAGGTLYIQDIFEFGSFHQAFKYLFASLFGIGYPTLTIRNGKRDVQPDQLNTLDKIGGPGHLDVKLGNAALLERGTRPTAVVGAGKHFLRRFEAIRDVLDLRETYRKKDDIDVLTKDGIEIHIRNIEATLRLYTGKRRERTESDPFPFSTQAVRAAVYERSVNEKGEINDWADGVMGAIAGRVSGWVSRQRLDRLTAPAQADPRAAIREEFGKSKVRDQFRKMGAEVIWMNIGHIDTPDDVDEQRANTWQSTWQRDERITEAYAKALETAYEEMGRAEGQATMLSTITNALETAAPGAALDRQRMIDLILLRIGHVLDTLAVSQKLNDVQQRNGSSATTKDNGNTAAAEGAS